ncbi:Phospholipase A(2) protein [Dioscorea alata]|uniref:phospholipase A2 n=2 Tax=Dioscorea TaxID=4672 RepID=A0AB40D2Z9_DIOCR|nr:phospholipase A2-alpha-like [Dioscorea cayenensis subsp. rotundata]KAH7655853.1 Phospholipase A(2) protein [Dioscorea alata]
MKWNIKLLLLFILSFQLQSIFTVKGLNIGLHFDHSAVSMHCSRRCESEHCLLPPFLRYGKYCGVLYTGCPGEEPCDGLDECCKVHDACIQDNQNDYLNKECNENLLNCISEFRDSGAKTFQGNKCKPEEVVDEISLIIQVALLAGRATDNP